jgi:polysaccharide export outer membrane protein
VFQIRSPMPLLNVLSLAQGIGENAGEAIVIVRGSGSQEIDLKALLESPDPDVNVLVHPGDTVKVLEAPMVYVVGEVRRPGAFPMRGRDELTVLRALALGEGLAPTANKGDAVILRKREGGGHTEIAVKLDRIMQNEDPDVALQPQDVLFVPASGGRVAARTVLDVLTRIIRPF